jgi:hypothetical protein
MWILKPDERLRDWKIFRNQISGQTLEQACSDTAHLWSYAPFVNYYIDPDRENSTSPWPDPWTLLHENYYCDVAKALGMLYTIYLSNHKPLDIELRHYQCRETREAFNLVWLAKGKYILNFNFDEVVNKTQLTNTLDLKFRYTALDLNLDQY